MSRAPSRAEVVATLFALALFWRFGVAAVADEKTDLFGTPVAPTNATLEVVRHAALAAYGPGLESGEEEQIIAQVVETDCQETYTRTTIGGDFRVDDDACGAKTAFGRLKGTAWRQNVNAIVTAVPDVISPTFFDPRLLWEQVLGDDGVSLIGEVARPSAAYVIAVSRKRQPPVWLEFDKSTGLLDRAIVTWETDTPSTLTYAAYRAERAGPIPWRVTDTDEHGSTMGTDEIKQYELTGRAASSDVAMPQSRDLMELPPGVDSVTVPVTFTGNREIVVRLTVAGRGLDFFLDSGTGAIVLDSGVSDALGLKPFGPVVKARGATVGRLNVTVPQIDIGGLSARDVTLERLPFSFRGGEATRYVGLLGFDFLAGGVIKLDYEDATLTYIRTSSFTPPTDATVVPLRLDEGVPMVAATIGGHAADDIIIDTGSQTPVIYSRFVKEAGWPVPDPKKGRVDYLFYPLASGNANGLVPCAMVSFSSVQLADLLFGGMIGYVSFGAPKFEQPESDGTLGSAILQYFDVYFDYPDGKMYLEPNALYKKAAGS